MATRRHVPPAFEAGMASYGLLPAAIDPHTHEILDKKLVSQRAEIEQLVADNYQLASTHVALGHDLAAVEEEIERLRVHIRSIRTESDIQIRLILDKMGKKGVDIQSINSIKKNLEQSINEAKELAETNQELSFKLKQATEELEKARSEVEKLPEMCAELENLQQEYQRLRTTFEYEKGLNVAKVEKMKLLEIDLVGKSTEVERLRADLLNAERRAQAMDSYGHAYMYPTPPPIHNNMPYPDGYGRPHPQTAIRPTGGAVVPGSAHPAWGRGPY